MAKLSRRDVRSFSSVKDSYRLLIAKRPEVGSFEYQHVKQLSFFMISSCHAISECIQVTLILRSGQTTFELKVDYKNVLPGSKSML